MKKLFISLFVLFSLMFSTNVFAATTNVSTNPITAKPVIIAEVNIRNAKIVSQEGNIFNISFLITNGVGLQTGIKYGVSLIQTIKNAQLVSDEKIYDESITLNSNSNIEKNIKYEAPSYLNGDYNLIISSKNNNNLPFASMSLGKVTLKATSKGIQILPETCSLSVIGDKAGTVYNIGQGVDIKPEENLKLKCTVMNSSNSEVSAVPSYETHLVSSFGNIVATTGGDIAPILIKAGEKKEFIVTLPKAITPQIYKTDFSLKDKELKSNPISVSYIIRGSNATIQSVSLDKDYYKKGQTSLVSFVYFPSVDVYYKGRYPVTSPTHIFSKVQIQNGKGRSCAKTQTKDLAGHVSTKVEIPTLVTSNCFDPKITVTLTDEKGATLDQKEFNIKTTSASEAKSNTIYIIILVLSILALMYFYKKRKNNTPTISTSTTSTSNEKIESNTLMSILFFFIISFYVFIPTNVVKADTLVDLTGVLTGIDASTPILLSYGLTGQYYNPANEQEYSFKGENINTYGSLMCGYFSNACANYGLYLYVDIAEAHANDLLGEAASSLVREKWSWFNAYTPIPLFSGTDTSAPLNFLGDDGVLYSGFGYTKQIPTIYSGISYQDNKINIAWFIQNNAHKNLYTAEIKNLNVGGYPAATVSVTVNDSKTPTPILKSVGTSTGVAVKWTSNEYAVSCDCSVLDKNGVYIKGCGTGIGEQFRTIKTDKTSKFSVNCKNTY